MAATAYESKISLDFDAFAYGTRLRRHTKLPLLRDPYASFLRFLQSPAYENAPILRFLCQFLHLLAPHGIRKQEYTQIPMPCRKRNALKMAYEKPISSRFRCRPLSKITPKSIRKQDFSRFRCFSTRNAPATAYETAPSARFLCLRP